MAVLAVDNFRDRGRRRDFGPQSIAVDNSSYLLIILKNSVEMIKKDKSDSWDPLDIEISGFIDDFLTEDDMH